MLGDRGGAGPCPLGHSVSRGPGRIRGPGASADRGDVPEPRAPRPPCARGACAIGGAEPLSRRGPALNLLRGRRGREGPELALLLAASSAPGRDRSEGSGPRAASSPPARPCAWAPPPSTVWSPGKFPRGAACRAAARVGWEVRGSPSVITAPFPPALVCLEEPSGAGNFSPSRKLVGGPENAFRKERRPTGFMSPKIVERNGIGSFQEMPTRWYP